jgi:hypothetical protein
MSDDFNSSEVEFEPRAVDPRYLRAGQKSIDAIIAGATADRLSTKRTVQQLQFGTTGAPGTRYLQNLWVNRFNAFRQESLRQNTTTLFTGDDLIRFFDAIISK